MQKETIQQLYRLLNDALSEKCFLKNAKLTKKMIQQIMRQEDWRNHIRTVLQQTNISATSVLEVCESTMAGLCSKVPEGGWLPYIYRYIRQLLFSDSVEMNENPAPFETAMCFYIEVLRFFVDYEKNTTTFSRTRDFSFATKEEMIDSHYEAEFSRFLECFENQYIYELMRIGREVCNFDTLGHIAGVHYVAMHVARQLHTAGVPIDLGLVSGAAAGHDIGKFGCKATEEKRIPYLHYYYTDQWFKSNQLPAIGHIATNHSTWDLELEDLPVESLVLIYADFRVKGNGRINGKEIIGFYTLKDSFDVILQKLDNVDAAKEDRYRHVYAKLLDFENYMIALGVNIDFQIDSLSPVNAKDKALLNIDETVEALKHMAIDHNISLMNKLGHEISFGNVLETARSAKNWKNSRAYINIFEEYFTYMTQKQKMMTLSFLYELLMHREGDIRRQAADLIGNIIVNFDEEYRKELPENVAPMGYMHSSIALWEKYLDMIILPDHKVNDRHRRWIGYALKRVVGSVLERCKKEDSILYLKCILVYYQNTNREESTAFILLDTLLQLPIDLMTREDIMEIFSFLKAFAPYDNLEVQAAILRFLQYFTEKLRKKKLWADKITYILSLIPHSNNISLRYLVSKILRNWSLTETLWDCNTRQIYKDPTVVSEIFLENLKAATPWLIKAVNIDLLLDRLQQKDKHTSLLHVATHLSNLVKVSEQVTVRHSAGEGLVKIAPLMSLDQLNEVAIELTKGLEIGEYEFSKYIPKYLGEIALYLHPAELDEFIEDLNRLLVSTNERVACVALDTMGIIIKNYQNYSAHFDEPIDLFTARKKFILGMLVSALADFRDTVNQEAFLVIGQYLFGDEQLSLAVKKDIFQFVSKKLLTLIENKENTQLAFFNNAASLNYIYRFISDYMFSNGEFTFMESDKIAFFPGTFDPFSLGHKGIAKEIRDMGFTVYLALDEFSWSKKTQPRMVRREIISMSTANEENIYLFPDDIPVNIANPSDLKRLRALFPNKEVFMVAGSDVVQNASSYKIPLVENSIQTFPHVLFLRDSQMQFDPAGEGFVGSHISGEVIELKLPMHLEDISSTRIRENIDDNRDIANLIDPVAQNFIYENSLYLREAQYKRVITAKIIQVKIFDGLTSLLKEEILARIKGSENATNLARALEDNSMNVTVIRDGAMESRIVGIAIFCHMATTQLYEEFKDMAVASHIRENTSGKIMLVLGSYVSSKTNIRDMEQLLATETLAYSLEKDYTYAVFSPRDGFINQRAISVLEHQGFRCLEVCPTNANMGKRAVYVADMKNPITLFQNIQTVLKEPFSHNERVLDTIYEAHYRLQDAMTRLYPGSLVLSFNAGIMHHRLVELITKANDVPSEPLPIRRLGKNMCVPFGKILRGMAIPNTVTKVLHTDKTFEPEIKRFHIQEYPNYSPLLNQVRTIKSFARPIILTDDLLHKGYRIRELDPLFKKEEIDIDRIVVGILSGRGKDLMDIQKRKVESVYFIPSLRAWFVESSIYPFIGGDSVERGQRMRANLLNSVNFILPYVMPGFLHGASRKSIYDFSMLALENSLAILQVLEEEYQRKFERNLTLNRLNEVIISPTCPDKGTCLGYDYHLAPSVYLLNDIEKLVRLRGFVGAYEV